MHERDGAAAVQLCIDWLELGLGHPAAEAGDVHVHPDAAEFVEAVPQSAQGRVDVRRRQHNVGGDGAGIASRQFGIAVVGQVDRPYAIGLVGVVGLAVRRKDLPLYAGGIHQVESALDVGGESETSDGRCWLCPARQRALGSGPG